MPNQHLINKIRELKEKRKELDAKITTTERKLCRLRESHMDQGDIEIVQKKLDDLKRKKNEVEMEKSHLQTEVQLQARLETKKKKLKESQRNMKAYKNQLKELDESKAQMEREILALQEKIHQLECEIEELKEKMEEKDNYTFQLKREVEQKELDHKNIIQRKTDEHAKEINDLTYDHVSRMKKQEKTHSKQLAEVFKSNSYLEETVQDLTKDLKMQSEYKEYASRYYEENQPILYIGQVCSDLETNWYRHVMPKFYINNPRSYKVKDIIEDLNDPKIPEDEKAKANGRWEQLKREINWEKNERLLDAIKELQGKRNQAAHPRKDLNEKGAKQAAKKLQEQGNLNDKASHKDVLNIIKFWVSSKKLS